MFYFVDFVYPLAMYIPQTLAYIVLKSFRKFLYRRCILQKQMENHAAKTVNKDEQSYNVSCLAFVAIVQLDCKGNYRFINKVF